MYLKTRIGYLLFIVLEIAQARVYKWIDSAGQVHYTDQPTANAQEIHLQEPQTSSVLTPDTSSAPYNLELMQPEANQIINTDKGEVVVSLLLEPDLTPEHSIQFTLDGGLISQKFTNTQVMLSPVAVGTHKIYATIVDETGKTIITSKTITFHVQKSAIPTSTAQSTDTVQPTE